MAGTLIDTQTLVPIEQILKPALEAGCRISWDNGQVRIVGPKQLRQLLESLAERRDELAQIVRPGPGNEVDLGGTQYPYEVWQGQQLRSNLAMDTETRRIESPAKIPELALATASDGHRHVLIHPDQLAAFVRQHTESTICFHNCGFDVWVVHQHLQSDPAAQQLWWEIADSGRIRDTMLLHSVYQLARSDAFPSPQNLAVLAKQYCDFSISKDDPLRTRYGDIIGVDWQQVPRGFFDYAIKDAIVTFQIYQELIRRVRQFESDQQISPELVSRWGHLTEKIQVRGAIALAAVVRTGISIDRDYLGQLRDGLEQQRNQHVEWLDREVPGLLTRDKVGELQVSKKTGSPRKSAKVLEATLEQIAEELGEQPERTKTGKITTARGYWSRFDHWPLIQNWIALEELNKLLSFFTKLDAERIHPRYLTLVRTGRTSSHGPNIQQLPREGHLRDAIIAPPDHSFYVVDYSFIELRTLAAVCEARYGWSELANVIRAGTDPHCFVAAMFEGVSLETFLSWKASDPKRYKSLRQRAKALNFGIPGGLGARTLVQYAQQTYQVELTLEEASQFREKLITQVFSELNWYLSEDGHWLVATALECNVSEVREHFAKPEYLGCMRRIVRGETTSSKGKAYSEEWLDRIWTTLEQLNQNEELSEAIRNRDTSERTGLARRLFASPVQTLTGRIRGRVSFTAARNTPFQGLAADGAKLALYRLIRAGYQVHAFVHDEFVLSLPDSADWSTEPQRIDELVCSAMAEVCGAVPIAVEGARMKRWYKQAEPVRDAATGELQVWTPKPEDCLEVVIETASVTEPPVVEVVKSERQEDPVTTAPVTNDPPKTSPRGPQPSRLSPPLKWFGGKHYLAKKIIELMPEHVHYVEPFAGGMAVLWAKPFEGTSEVANDIFGRLINFYRHLADEELFADFLRRVEALPVSQELWQESQQQADDPLEDAVRFFILNRQSRSGQMQSFVTLSRNRTRRGRNEQVSSWLSAIEGLQEVHERLQRVVLLNDDAVSVIQKQDGPNTLFYADPPYLHETRVATNVYAHEMTNAEHQRLLDTLTQVQGKVILSGYPSPLYDQALSEWRREEIEIDNKASAAKNKKKMTEVLWMNY